MERKRQIKRHIRGGGEKLSDRNREKERHTKRERDKEGDIEKKT